MEITNEMVERGLAAKDKIDPFGRDKLGMSPQEFRRHIILKILEAALEQPTHSTRSGSDTPVLENQTPQ